MKKYLVFNVTDAIYASPTYMTEAQADKFIANFPKAFEFQGFYRTAKGERIHPECVELVKMPVDKNGDQDAEVMNAAMRRHNEKNLTIGDLINKLLNEPDDGVDYPCSEFACTWSPNITELAMTSRENRAPYVLQLKNTTPKNC